MEFQRAEMVAQPCVQLVRVGGDAIDHAVAVFADQVVERLQLPAHLSCLIGEGLDQGRAAAGEDGLERCHLRGQGLVNVGRAGADRGRGVAREPDEASPDLHRFGVELGERVGRRLLDLRLRVRRLDGHRADDATGRVVDKGFDSRALVLDRAAQLGPARIELLAPALNGRVESRRGLRCAIEQKRRQALTRAFESFAQRVAAVDDRLLQPLGCVVEAMDQIRAMNDNGVGKAPACGVETLE